jgi:hypothetical protein
MQVKPDIARRCSDRAGLAIFYFIQQGSLTCSRGDWEAPKHQVVFPPSIERRSSQKCTWPEPLVLWAWTTMPVALRIARSRLLPTSCICKLLSRCSEKRRAACGRLFDGERHAHRHKAASPPGLFKDATLAVLHNGHVSADPAGPAFSLMSFIRGGMRALPGRRHRNRLVASVKSRPN